MRPSSILKAAWGMLRNGGNLGRCPICAGPTLFVRTGPWARDQYRCVRCRSIPRWRALFMVLEETRPDWRTAAMHESSPDGTLSAKFRREARNFSYSQFFPGIELGLVHQGVRNEDLRSLTFPDSSFDILVTQDVLEHVPEPDRAFREIARILKPGGCHVFSVPLHSSPTKERSRYDDDGTLRHILPPEYHGNPVDAKGALVFTDWGPDLPERIDRVSGTTTRRFDFHDLRHGLDGEFLSILVSMKHA